jgi:LmbE family N-acetylglucosaminyl deacetylase
MTKFSRRHFISSGGAALLATGITGHNIDQTGRKLKIVVAGGHPGDPEYGVGGTIARYTGMGHDVVLFYLNRGEGGIGGKTGSEAAEIRSAEAVHACEILKARPVFARQIDGKSVVDAAHYNEIRDILKAESPDIIFNQWPIDNHRDHRAVSSLVYDAWLELSKSKQVLLYYYEVSNGEDTLMFSPTVYVDISGLEPIKRKACYAHASQSPDRFYPLQEQVSKFRGIECGKAQAEAFIEQILSRKDMLPM